MRVWLKMVCNCHYISAVVIGVDNTVPVTGTSSKHHANADFQPKCSKTPRELLNTSLATGGHLTDAIHSAELRLPCS